MGYFLITAGVMDVPSCIIEAKSIEEAVEKCGGVILGEPVFHGHGDVWKVALKEDRWPKPKEEKAFWYRLSQIFQERIPLDPDRNFYIYIQACPIFPLDLRVPEAVS